MKTLTCEMCGSTNMVKEDGMYMCKSCGTKYSVEEARKMMMDDNNAPISTVKVDTSDELKNLYEVARRAKDSDNNENAAKYYDMILVKDPQSWEAYFYVVYFKAMSCKIAEIWSAANSLVNCVDPVLQLVRDHVLEKNQQGLVIEELKLRFVIAAKMLSGAAKSHYDGIDAQIKDQYTQEYINNAAEGARILYVFGEGMEIYFGEKYGDAASYVWKEAIVIHNQYLPYLADKDGNKKKMTEYAERIRKYDNTYQMPQFNESSGACYVATAVYGSYDCPQVWTLRRYRDYTLAQTWYGRGFVHLYYAISPTLVRCFGETGWFKAFWKRILDRMVHRLNEEGVSDTRYLDRNW
ncbi:MAG: TFIIB-type zinc finger domain-containing protein [Bacteroidales bacterium]|nr:TFIIB-type zinc finger domain-containing protein [Bacteroidales bacterium]